MKKNILLLLFVTGSVFSQTKHTDSFFYDGKEIKYCFYYSNSKEIIAVNTFFVFVNNQKNIKKCLKNKHTRPYILDMPADISKEKQEEIFLEFVHDITSKAKLVESNFYLVSDKDYTALYRDIFNKVLRYKGSYLNDIKSIYINPTEAEICKMLQ